MVTWSHGRTTKPVIPFCTPIEGIKLLIAGHNNLHLSHILDVEAPPLSGARARKEIGIQRAASSTLVSQIIRTIITMQVDVGVHMRNRHSMA